jgi:formylglycine-generating enzyme required for sulfatase activity
MTPGGALLPDRVVVPADGSTLLRVPGGRHPYGDAEAEVMVTLPTFFIAASPVTNDAYDRFCTFTGHPRPRWYGRRFASASAPVVGVSFPDAVAYAAWAGLRLPAEREWEAAARLGFDSDVPRTDVAWFRENSDGHTHAVGERCPTGPGFHDLLGNVFEWTTDWYDATCTYRVVRGGSWKSVEADVRPTHRDFNPPVDRMNCIGFRCVWTPPHAAEAA